MSGWDIRLYYGIKDQFMFGFMYGGILLSGGINIGNAKRMYGRELLSGRFRFTNRLWWW